MQTLAKHDRNYVNYTTIAKIPYNVKKTHNISENWKYSYEA